jgi:hypothetical protein
MRVRGWVGDERERTRRRMETRWGRAASRWMVNGSWCVRGDGMRLDDFIQRFNFFLSEIIDSIRFDSIRFDSIRFDSIGRGSVCRVRSTDDFYDDDFVSFRARLNRRDYARVWITNSRTGAPTRRVERLAIFRVFSRRR